MILSIVPQAAGHSEIGSTSSLCLKTQAAMKNGVYQKDKCHMHTERQNAANVSETSAT